MNLIVHKCLSFFSPTLQCNMKFGIYLPPGVSENEKCPVLFYLSGLTCTEQNVITKSGFQKYAAQYKIIVVAPDTSPSKFISYYGGANKFERHI